MGRIGTEREVPSMKCRVRRWQACALVVLLAAFGGSTFWAWRDRGSDPLARSFREAVERIRRHQKPEGYWETLKTHTRDVAHAKPEVNVFTPALMVDILEPIARDIGLTDVLDRARAYLARQIEPTGLVRYHGPPGNLPERGCELPPDSDDTALVWRVARVEDGQRLNGARAVLARYRTADGLYRTWMADADTYRCYYTHTGGHDPNPADIGIQMHLYLFFARHDRAAAGALCEALRTRMAEDGLWVWYTEAPLLPVFREADLARAGCRLRVPERRLRQVLAGQERYLAFGQLARDALLNDGSSRPEEVLSALRDLAAHDFRMLSETPPLVYHGDLTAPVLQWHWSEDIGYAIWLRVYLQSVRETSPSLSLSKGRAGPGTLTAPGVAPGPTVRRGLVVR